MQIINIEIHSEINICFVNVNLKKKDLFLHIYASFCYQVSGSGVKPDSSSHFTWSAFIEMENISV